MDAPHRKDPERQRLGRLGALVVHASGKTNVAPARAAWEAELAAEFDISPTLDPAERERRMRAAMRVRMTRIARIRWGNRKAATPNVSRVAAEELDDGRRRIPEPA